MTADPPIPTPAPEENSPGLAKTLGGWQILLYGLGSMLGAGIYALVGKASAGLGNAVWAAFLVAMTAALLTGLSYACLGGRYAKAGGAAYVTHRALRRPLLSYVVGLAVMMSGLTSMATGSQAMVDNIANAMHLSLPDWMSKLSAIGIVFLIGCVIYRGMRESMWLNILCTIIEASGLIFIIIVGAKYWGGVDYMETPGDAAAGGGAGSGLTAALILNGAVLTFFSFWRELALSKAPLMDVAHRAAPWFKGIDGVFAVITLFAIGNTALLNYLMGSRLLYGMSGQGLLPPLLGKVHPVRRTPHVAIVVLFVIVSALILAGGVKQLAEATVLLLLSVFTVVNFSLVVLKRRPSEPKGGFDVPLAVPILGSVVCAVLIVKRIHTALTSTEAGTHIAPLIALAVIAVSVALYRVLKPADEAVATAG
ncbi:MAG: amino acid permease [Verrucomicrobiaceae bacterium]|nr:MAG: amino acid permease [Verrucomicrobiaceae bacterium]